MWYSLSTHNHNSSKDVWFLARQKKGGKSSKFISLTQYAREQINFYSSTFFRGVGAGLYSSFLNLANSPQVDIIPPYGKSIAKLEFSLASHTLHLFQLPSSKKMRTSPLAAPYRVQLCLRLSSASPWLWVTDSHFSCCSMTTTVIATICAKTSRIHPGSCSSQDLKQKNWPLEWVGKGSG